MGRLCADMLSTRMHSVNVIDCSLFSSMNELRYHVLNVFRSTTRLRTRDLGTGHSTAYQTNLPSLGLYGMVAYFFAYLV